MQDHYITLKNGIALHALVAGQPKNPPIILLHGYPTSCELWRNCIPALAEDFFVYAPDLPGHGKSDKPLDIDYDLNFFVDFLVQLQDGLGFAKAALVAHDLGGNAALGFVCRHPERVSRFVIMNTAPYIEWSILLHVLIRAVQSPGICRLALQPWIFTMLFKYLLLRRPELADRAWVERYRQPWANTPHGAELLGKVVAIPAERMVEPREEYRKIALPTLVLWGKGDRLFSEAVARRLQADIPGAQLELLESCGHFPQEEAPDQVVKHVRDFLCRENRGLDR